MMSKHQAGFNFLCYFLSLDVGEDSQTELLSQLLAADFRYKQLKT